MEVAIANKENDKVEANRRGNLVFWNIKLMPNNGMDHIVVYTRIINNISKLWSTDKGCWCGAMH